VHHPVTDGIDRKAAQELAELGVLGPAVPLIEIKGRGDLVGRAEHAELEAARPGVDDKDAGLGRPPGHIPPSWLGLPVMAVYSARARREARPYPRIIGLPSTSIATM
jgi:hypothetical protein